MNKNKILIDISNIAEIAGYVILENNLKKFQDELNRTLDVEEKKTKKEKINNDFLMTKNFIKETMSFIINKIEILSNELQSENEDIHICFDPKSNWRKTYYTDYKNRENSLKKEKIKIIKEQLFHLCPLFGYKRHIQNKLEADDLIYLLSEEFKKDEKVRSITVYSKDEDLKQILIENPKVQYLIPKENKKIEINQKEAQMILVKKIIQGDTSDNILNFRSYSNITNEKLRNKRFGEKTLEPIFSKLLTPKTTMEDIFEMVKEVISENFKEFQEEMNDMMKNLEFNFNLVSFKRIPQIYIEKYSSLKYNEPNRISNKYIDSYSLKNYLRDSEYRKYTTKIGLPYLNGKEIEDSKNIIYVKTNNNYNLILDKTEDIIVIDNNVKNKNKIEYLKINDTIILEDKEHTVKEINDFENEHIKELKNNIIDTITNELKLNNKRKELFNIILNKTNKENDVLVYKEDKLSINEDVSLSEFELIKLLKTINSDIKLFNKDKKTIDFFEKNKDFSIEEVIIRVSEIEFNKLKEERNKSEISNFKKNVLIDMVRK